MLSFQKIVLAVLATALTVLASNTVTFVSQDRSPRTVYFMSNPGHANIDNVHVPGGDSVVVTIPWAWEGNAYAVIDGRPVVPGMLMETSFNQAHGVTYFDVSAIVNVHDYDGVHLVYPASGNGPTSGCETFPCDNAYYHPDDVQTKSTRETDLIVTLVSTRPRNNKAVAEPLQGSSGPTYAGDDIDDDNGNLSRRSWKTGGPRRIRQ
ncbi:hypothetical protein MFIFM68171_04596 [Madurella fahalii]|uniref:DNase1 protein n=1 Tax=Madurella fahalii TaxID=1157608 RepID=A0ABQ0G9D2_9PEZI